MENSEINKIIDIRQSPEWGEYLQSLGWRKHSLGGLRNLYSLRAGPLTVAKMQRPDDLSVENLSSVDGIAGDFKFSFLKLEPSLSQNTDLLTGSEYKISLSPLCPPSTIFIDLKSDIDLLHHNLSRTARYSISRSKREGGSVQVVNNPTIQVLNEILPVLQDTAKHQKFLSPDLKDLQIKLDLWKEKFIVATVRNDQGTLCGTNIFLGFNENVWHVHGGTTPEGRKTKLGYLLLWESILHLKSCGYRFLDLEGKDDRRFPAFTKNWGGFSYFKEKFHGTEVQYPYPMIKYYNGVLKYLSRVYKSAIPL